MTTSLYWAIVASVGFLLSMTAAMCFLAWTLFSKRSYTADLEDAAVLEAEARTRENERRLFELIKKVGA